MSPRSCLAVAGTLLVLCLVSNAGAASGNSQAGASGQIASGSGETTITPNRPGAALRGSGQNLYLAQDQGQEEKREEERAEKKHERQEAVGKRRKVSAADIAEVNRGLNSARLMLQKMPPSYQGHRENALKYVDQALYEVQQMYKVHP
jgi:hypothetical protein